MGLKSVRVGEHISMLEGWNIQKEHGSSTPPFSPYLALFTSSIWLFLNCILCNKPVIANTTDFWVLSFQQITEPGMGRE